MILGEYFQDFARIALRRYATREYRKNPIKPSLINLVKITEKNHGKLGYINTVWNFEKNPGKHLAKISVFFAYIGIIISKGR